MPTTASPKRGIVKRKTVKTKAKKFIVRKEKFSAELVKMIKLQYAQGDLAKIEAESGLSRGTISAARNTNTGTPEVIKAFKKFYTNQLATA